MADGLLLNNDGGWHIGWQKKYDILSSGDFRITNHPTVGRPSGHHGGLKATLQVKAFSKMSLGDFRKISSPIVDRPSGHHGGLKATLQVKAFSKMSLGDFRKISSPIVDRPSGHHGGLKATLQVKGILENVKLSPLIRNTLPSSSLPSTRPGRGRSGGPGARRFWSATFPG